LQVLYDALPGNIKPCLLAEKKVEGVEIDDDSVTVRCSDGTTEKGSILIGADGVHSRIRNCMRELALQDVPCSEEGQINDEDPFVSTYRCMYGNTSVDIPGLKTGVEWDLHSADIAMQFFPAKERGWFLFYQKLPKQTREAKTYDDDAKAQVAAQVADYYVTDTVRFKDVWAAMRWCMLADLPEGTVRHRHWKRIVLVGDAASRQTPNLGQGWNCGVQDVVVLVNSLHKLLTTRKENPPGLNEIEKVFQEYQRTQQPAFDSIFGVAAGTTRAATWDTWLAWLNDRLIMPWFGGSKNSFRQGLGTAISRGHVLNFLSENETLDGVIPWLHRSKYEREES
jgi:2-polyprenyl-6-methoxyphenol hydroxylase-like FAD-dependent oxidoreductase